MSAQVVQRNLGSFKNVQNPKTQKSELLYFCCLGESILNDKWIKYSFNIQKPGFFKIEIVYFSSIKIRIRILTKKIDLRNDRFLESFSFLEKNYKKYFFTLVSKDTDALNIYSVFVNRNDALRILNDLQCDVNLPQIWGRKKSVVIFHRFFIW